MQARAPTIQSVYNVLFKNESGIEAESQITAFEDTWHWTDEAESAFDEVMHSGNSDAADMLRAMRTFLGDNDVMAYIANANLALSVTLTTVATLLAPFVTPFYMQWLAGQLIPIDTWGMMWSIIRITILPIVAGIVLSQPERATRPSKL